MHNRQDPPLQCLILFDKEIFGEEEGKYRLWDREVLYTQLWNDPIKKGNWSIVLTFTHTPYRQGCVSLAASIRFLVEKAPHELLRAGFVFPYKVGANTVGQCIVFQPGYSLSNCLTRQIHHWATYWNIYNLLLSALAEDLQIDYLSRLMDAQSYVNGLTDGWHEFHKRFCDAFEQYRNEVSEEQRKLCQRLIGYLSSTLQIPERRL